EERRVVEVAEATSLIGDSGHRHAKSCAIPPDLQHGRLARQVARVETGAHAEVLLTKIQAVSCLKLRRQGNAGARLDDERVRVGGAPGEGKLLRLDEEDGIDEAGNRQECDGRSDEEAWVHLLLATRQGWR